MYQHLILTISALFVVNAALAQGDLKIKLDSIAKSGLEQGIPGIQILISKNDETHIYNYGFHDVDKTTEVNDSTNWRFGSITKLFTATMILQLESEGKLSINDLTSQYVDLKRHSDAKITIKHLLNHSSGLYNYTSNKRLKWDDSAIQCVNISLKRKLNFAPGSEYQYCNTGYAILGLIIEKVTGLSYEQNLKKRIIEPCQLQSMFYSETDSIPSNTARGYIKKRKKYKGITSIDYHWANSAGAILGNSRDMGEFVKQLLNGTLLDSVQLQKMLTPTLIYRDLNAEGLEWFYHAIGLCWDLNLDKTESPVYISHGGNAQGYNCDVHYNLRNNLTIIIGMNLFPSGEYEPVFSTQNELIDAIHNYHKSNN